MANVVAEFKTGGWGHTRTQGFTVADEDCIVCHLEGSMATLSKTAKHGDGNVDLRDHGTATNDVAITDLGGAAITFKRFTTSFATGSRTSAVVNTAVRDVVTRKFCLGCHKSGGSSNTTAGQGGIAAGGTALKPFGSAGGTVLDINSQFATTNSSKHPVLGPLNRDYPTAALVANPYKPSGTRGTSGTLSQGVIINCFDCHNQSGTPLTHRTVSAHGNLQTIRGTIGVSSPTLCAICHLTYDSTNPGHPAGSAFTISDGHMGTSQMYLCVNCHASSISAARPVRGQEVHGVNMVLTGANTKIGRWAAGGAPIAFIRNVDQIADHSPKKIGATSYTVTCMNGSAGSCSHGSQTYTPGGTY